MCIGHVNAGVPESKSVRLKVHGENDDVALAHLWRLLHAEFKKELPVLVVKERVLPLVASVKVLRNRASTIVLQTKLHAVVEVLCKLYNVPYLDVMPATVRKHFIGKANMGDRAETKRAVVARCQVLGYMPDSCYDNDRADAAATWDWAAATHLRRGMGG
jgi:hypothetical protein